METHLYFALKLVHLLAMALWIGGPPVAVFRLRRSLEAGPKAGLLVTERLIAVTPLFVGAALLTVLSGGILVALAGGLSQVPPRILVGAALTVPVFLIGGAMNRPALRDLRAHFAEGSGVAEAEPLLRRFLLAHRLEQAIRLLVLALMVLR